MVRYTKRMKQNGTFADHIAVESMAKLLKRKIHVVTSSEGGAESDVLEQLINEEAANEGPPILIGHYHEYHYQSLDLAVPEIGKSMFFTCNPFTNKVRLHLHVYLIEAFSPSQSFDVRDRSRAP